MPLYGESEVGAAASAVTGNAFLILTPARWPRRSLGGQLGSSWRRARGQSELVAEG